MSSGFKVSLIFYGPGGTGKTMLAKSVFKLLDIEPLVVNQINDFKSYDSSRHKGILIDDLDAESLSRLEVLNIIDTSGKSVRCLYGIITPTALISKFITTNRLEDFTKYGRGELVRRLKSIYIPESISSKFNIQINIQQNNYFFGESLGYSKEKLEETLLRLEKLNKKPE